MSNCRRKSASVESHEIDGRPCSRVKPPFADPIAPPEADGDGVASGCLMLDKPEAEGLISAKKQIIKGKNMSEHTVVGVVSGDSFVVSPDWSREGIAGSLVRPIGLIAPELGTEEGDLAKERLADLILNQKVEIKETIDFDRGRLICNVLYQGDRLVHRLRPRLMYPAAERV